MGVWYRGVCGIEGVSAWGCLLRGVSARGVSAWGSLPTCLWYRWVQYKGGVVERRGCGIGGVCLGVSAKEGICPGGVCLGGVCLGCLPRWCLPSGVSAQRGVCPRGVCP